MSAKLAKLSTFEVVAAVVGGVGLAAWVAWSVFWWSRAGG